MTLALTLATASVTPSLASTTESEIIFGNSQIKPWGMLIDGVPQGLLVDVERALALETHQIHKLQLLPYARVIHSIYVGDVDMAGLFDGRINHSKLIKVAPITNTRVIIIAKTPASTIDDIGELRGLLVGHMRGSKYGPIFDDADHFTKVPINSMSQALAMLKRGRIDAMAGVDQTFFWSMKQMQLSPDEFTELTTISRPTISLYMSQHSQHKALIPVYRNAMQRLKEKGIIEKIFGHSEDWNLMQGWSQPWQPAPINTHSPTTSAPTDHKRPPIH
tara:strand:- start:23682 stop:24509 length:828 start_codon:yes stop_codon:yes gene_type:complete